MAIYEIAEYDSCVIEGNQSKIDSRFKEVIKINWVYEKSALCYRNEGYAGIIKSGEDSFILKPKMPVENFCKLLNINHFNTFTDVPVKADSYNGIFEAVLRLYAEECLRLVRQGLYRCYEKKTEKLQFIRGRLNVEKAIRQPVSIYPECVYGELTTDNLHNVLYFMRYGSLCPSAWKTLI
jgi:5-methylcytosine-specific restriction enzyme subunit McrC